MVYGMLYANSVLMAQNTNHGMNASNAITIAIVNATMLMSISLFMLFMSFSSFQIRFIARDT